ncbi:MAG: IS4 family transposase [Isosphaeraceae bacterium]
MPIIPTIARAVQSLLGPLAEEVAATVLVVRRRRKFSPATLARTFLLGFLAKPNATAQDLARTAARGGVLVIPQALTQRFTDAMACFLEGLFRRAITQRVQADRTLGPLVERFPAVLLLDSTTITLPAELADRFPGCGGSYGGGRAAMKLQVQIDLRHGALDAIAIEAGKDCDPRSSLQSAPRPAGSLRIADLGYFDIEVLRDLQDRGESWVSRLAFGTEIVTPEGAPIARIEDLFTPRTKLVDRPILLGKEARLPCRIVIWRVPEEVANRRRQELIATARDKGNRPPSRERLAWCDWTIIVTNAPDDRLRPEEVGVLYRARWQIELVFKRWKSLGRVADLTGATVTEKLVRLWSRLLAMVVQHWLLLACAWGDLRCSLYKAGVTIRESAHDLIGTLDDPEGLTRQIERIGQVLGKVARRDKRKQPGTFELLNKPSLLGYES